MFTMGNSFELQEALRLLVGKCPRLVASCYWAGTSAIAIEELSHRQSFDLGFHTIRALQDVRPILAEMRAVFQDDLQVVQAPDEFGSGFRASLRLRTGAVVALEVLSNYEDVSSNAFVESTTHPALRRVTLERYLADKIQCIVERAEARDLVDINAVLRAHPELETVALNNLAVHDAVLMVERLQNWTPAALKDDLSAYKDVDPTDAITMRDTLLEWIQLMDGGSKT